MAGALCYGRHQEHQRGGGRQAYRQSHPHCHAAARLALEQSRPGAFLRLCCCRGFCKPLLLFCWLTPCSCRPRPVTLQQLSRACRKQHLAPYIHILQPSWRCIPNKLYSFSALNLLPHGLQCPPFNEFDILGLSACGLQQHRYHPSAPKPSSLGPRGQKGIKIMIRHNHFKRGERCDEGWYVGCSSDQGLRAPRAASAFATASKK